MDDWLLRRANVGCSYIYTYIYIYDCVVLWLHSPHLAVVVVVVVIAVNALGFGSQKLRLSGRVFAAGQYPFRPSPPSAFSGQTDVCAGNKLVACYYRLNRLNLFWGINVYIYSFLFILCTTPALGVIACLCNSWAGHEN